MKQKNLKKILFINMLLCISSFSIKAQMLDLMGSMGISGTQTIQDVKAVGQMNQALNSNQFLGELRMKSVYISTSYFGEYQNMPTQSEMIGNVEITFRPVNNGSNFEAFIPSVTPALCSSLLKNRFDNVISYRLVINGKNKEYTASQIQSKKGICDGISAIALIFN